MTRVRGGNYKALMVLPAMILVCGGGLLVAARGREEAHLVPAVYVFGDSTVDVGNNQFLPGFKPGQLPYGIDFPGSRPTGRFSNGYNTADSIGEFFLHFPFRFLSDRAKYMLVIPFLTRVMNKLKMQRGLWDSRGARRLTCR